MLNASLNEGSNMKLCGRASIYGVIGCWINPSWWTH